MRSPVLRGRSCIEISAPSPILNPAAILSGLHQKSSRSIGQGERMAASARESAFRVAKRLDEVGFSDIVVIRNKMMELRAAGQTVHAFHGGEPFFETPDSIRLALYAAVEENKTRYAPSSGIAPLRTALVEKLRDHNGIPTTPDEVLITVGGAHALYCAFQTVLDPGSD